MLRKVCDVTVSIPCLNERGFLPPGVHGCSLNEIRKTFGTFNATDRRPSFFRKLETLVAALCKTGVAKALIVNGSFTTAKIDPNDIDLVLVLPQGHDFSRDLTPDEYNLLSKRRVRKTFGFDMFVAEDESLEYVRYTRFFQDVKNQPGESKGVLRVEL